MGFLILLEFVLTKAIHAFFSSYSSLLLGFLSLYLLVYLFLFLLLNSNSSSDCSDASSARRIFTFERDGMRQDRMGWDGMGWDGIGWDGMG